MTRWMIALALLATACGGGFAPGDRIERTRVVAASSHVDGDPTRAWALPGEHVTTDYLIVSPPSSSDPLATEFVACEQAAMAGLNGIAGCDGATFDDITQPVAAAAVPTLQNHFQVPDDITVGYSTSVLTYLGTCIGDGLITLDPTAPTVTCDGGARSELYRLDVRVVPDLLLANHNPNIHDERYFLNDVLWLAPDTTLAATGCAAVTVDGALPRIRVSSEPMTRGGPRVEPREAELTFGCSDDDREMYPGFDADMRPVIGREHIDVAHFVTLGSISSSTRIDDDDPALAATTRWTPPTARELSDTQRAALDSGLLVRFWFVARDGRGGSDWVERDLCLIP